MLQLNDTDFTAALLAELEDGWHAVARPSQLPPTGDWAIWLMLGGRGAGKSRTERMDTRAGRRGQAAHRIAGPDRS